MDSGADWCPPSIPIIERDRDERVERVKRKERGGVEPQGEHDHPPTAVHTAALVDNRVPVDAQWAIPHPEHGGYLV